MRSQVPRTTGLVLAAVQGLLLAQSALVIPVLLTVARGRGTDADAPSAVGEQVLVLGTAAVLAIVGGCLAFAAWKAWRTRSRPWSGLTLVLLAAQPLVWWYDAGLGGHFQWWRGLALPAAAAGLLLWPAPDGEPAAARAHPVPPT